MKLRSMFVSRSDNHTLVQLDLSQAESWVVAYLSDDPNMKDALIHHDIHTVTATALFDLTSPPTKPQRYTGKRCNHAFAYRMSPQRFVQVFNKDAGEMGLPQISMRDGVSFSNKWIKLYSGIKIWWSNIEDKLGKTRTLVTPYGRVRTFFGQWGQDLFKKATAFLPQSTVADHFNGAVQREVGIQGGLLQIYKQIVAPSNGEILLCNQSHDSCILDVPDNRVAEVADHAKMLLLRPFVVNSVELLIPVSIETGKRWGELSDYQAKV